MEVLKASSHQSVKIFSSRSPSWLSQTRNSPAGTHNWTFPCVRGDPGSSSREEDARTAAGKKDLGGSMGMFWVIVLPCVSPQTKEAAGSQLWLTGVPLLSSIPA